MKKIAFIIAIAIGFSSFTNAHTDHFTTLTLKKVMLNG